MKPLRSDNAALPSPSELSSILETEVDRAVPTDKLNTHYPEFRSIIDLFQHLGEPTDLFTDDLLDIHEAVGRAREILDDVVAKLLTSKPDAATVELLNAVYDYLSQADEPQPSDLIFVFGAKTPLRAEKALELYRAGIAPTIIVSGGSPIYADNVQESEAATYRNFLVESGVPMSAIIVEDGSITVPDNVRRSLNLLDDLKLSFSRMTLVNSPYSQRRGWAIFRKHLPDSVQLYRVNSGTGEIYSRDNWCNQEVSLRVVLNEYMKMRASVVYNTA